LLFFKLKKHATKSHLQALVLGIVRSDISGHGKVVGAQYFHESQEHAIFSILVIQTGKLQPVFILREKPVLLALLSNLKIPVPASYPVFCT